MLNFSIDLTIFLPILSHHEENIPDESLILLRKREFPPPFVAVDQSYGCSNRGKSSNESRVNRIVVMKKKRCIRAVSGPSPLVESAVRRKPSKYYRKCQRVTPVKSSAVDVKQVSSIKITSRYLEFEIVNKGRKLDAGLTGKHGLL